MPLSLMNALNPTTPRLASAGSSARFSGTIPPQRPKSTSAFRDATATFASKAATVVVGGWALSGISRTVVTPPRAAPRVPASHPSHPARPVEVDVAVDHAGKHNQSAGIDDFFAIRDLTADGGDDAIGDGDVGGLLASREDYGTATYDDGVAHRTSSITISCAPSQSVSLPISASCSCPCVIVAK